MGANQSSTAGPGPTMYTATASASVAAAQATALTLSPTSNVPGKTFDRFVQIFLENQDYNIAAGDPNLAYLATKGVVLDQYFAITHPSQPNYIAAAGASTHGVLLDNPARIGADVETIVDLLEFGNVSWSLYQEDMPYSGFEGDYVNQKTGANDYVRKHNPLMSYDSVTRDPNRLAKSKNFTLFHSDLAANTLPQWMFITPNMTNDGHDSDVATAGNWARSFLDPLLANKNFNTDKTLIVLTFDEAENYLLENRVYTLLLGGAVAGKEGTHNSTQFNHYSLTKTVEVNWDLGDLEVEDLTPGKDLEARLNKQYGPGNPYYEDFCRLVRQGLKEGWVAETELAGQKYRRGKIALPSAKSRYFSITTVYMESEDEFSGQYHQHPYGEINCVVQLDENNLGAELQGMQGWQGAGWTSPGPGTHHYPRVRGGALVALFFLPAGRISYKATPDMPQPIAV
ncbi:hypothetical protein E8E14_011141 [Neopestalotiopsis sp. 37M]|nr:hypothetical protein E8E14_011141 [Neopestalotiopsis sp. 37M]